MLFPQFSLRWILGAMTLLAVVFLFVGQAVDGKPWAIGVSLSVLALVVAMLVHVGLFFIVWLFSQIFARRAGQRRPAEMLRAGSPFVSAEVASARQSPPQGIA